MAPTPLHVLMPRNDPSLGELFHHFPAKVWKLIKLLLFGLSLVAALFALVFGCFFLFSCTCIYGPHVINWLKSGKWWEVVDRWGKEVRRVSRNERIERVWRWVKDKSARREAGAVDTEELEHLSVRDSEERESSPDGKTLPESDQDEDGNGQATIKEEMELDSEDNLDVKP